MTYVKAAAATQQPQPLSVNERDQWNGFIDYLQKTGMKGNPALDNRDTGLSQQVFDNYKAQNPHFTLNYNQVPQVQQDLQDYRNNVVQKWKANPGVADVKSADEIMPGLSPVDGWLGSKTSSHKYPVATINNNGIPQNFGTNTGAYDAAMAKLKGSN